VWRRGGRRRRGEVGEGGGGRRRRGKGMEIGWYKEG
jgi:hypothetical protein